nr:G-protein coupled receptor 4-like [Pogona vitticeps]XP_020665170.1 G-protein coupled receptor 4-like [Pogona vitticeps]
MNNTTHACQSMPYSTTKYFKLPVYTVVLLVGFPLSILALCALVRQMKRSVVLSVYIISLVLANLLQILTLPFWMYHSYHDHLWGLGKELCVVAILAFRTNFYAKNGFLCLIAMERYIGLVHPLRFHRLQTVAGAGKVSVVAWLLVMVLCAIGIGLQVNHPGPWHEHCLDGSEKNHHYAQFKVGIIGLAFFLPFFLMGFFYFRVLFELRKVVSLEKRTKRQIYGFISLITATFFLLFTPYQVTLSYRFYREVMLSKSDSPALCNFLRNVFIYQQATLCLSTVGNILDPLLYILLLKDVRAELKETLSFRAPHIGNSHKSEEHRVSQYRTTEQM